MSVAPWPKRRETTFTSSGWETRSAMGLLRCFLPVLVKHLIHLLGGQVLVKVVIHLRRRSPTASSNAFHLFQRKQSGSRRSLVTHAQLLSAMMQDFFAPAHQTADVSANLHVELSSRFRSQHRVIADHVVHFEYRQIKSSSKFRDNLI